MEIDDIKKSLHKLAFEVNSAVLLSAYKADYKIPPKSDFAMSYDNIDDSILCGKVLKGIFILKNLWNERTEEEAYKEAYKYLSVLEGDFEGRDNIRNMGKLISSVAKSFTDDTAKDIAESTLDNYKKTLFGGYKYKYENKP